MEINCYDIKWQYKSTILLAGNTTLKMKGIFTMNEILEFIKKFKFKYSKELVEVFTSGNCYYFAVILKDRFNGEIYYLPIENHFVCKIDKDYYDITGFAPMNESPIKWTTYKNEDEKHYNRIVRDCINFDTRRTI
jgi:hypothetical protein